MRPVAELPRRAPPGAVNVPVSRHELRDEGRLRPRRGRAGHGVRRDRRRGHEATRGLRSVAFLDVAGLRPRRRPRDDRSGRRSDELDRPARRLGAIVVDVRERDERDEGYIPGSRNIPYRLLRTCCPDLPDGPPDRHDLRDSGPAPRSRRASCRARGLDARPVVDGGMTRLARPRRDDGQLPSLRHLSRCRARRRLTGAGREV